MHTPVIRESQRRSIDILRGLAALAVIAFVPGCDQAVPSTPGSSQAALTSAEAAHEVLGFEKTAGWQPIWGSTARLETSPAHTEGQAALAIVAPSGYVRLESAAISSGAPKLAGLVEGAAVALDVSLPTSPNPYWAGAIQMYLTAPSRNVYNAYLGQVELTGRRTGAYRTLRFVVPPHVIAALGTGSVPDLRFGIALNAPWGSTGTYLFDNLRIKNAVLPPRPSNASAIQSSPSVVLVAWKSHTPGVPDQAANATFSPAIVQVPRTLHVVKGNAGQGTASLELGVGTGATTRCTYAATPSGADFAWSRCTPAATPGELLPADRAALSIAAADPTAPKTKVSMQLALNPVGDEIVDGLPPIPTWFGRSAAEVAAALDAFVTEQRSWSPPDNVVVRLPTPDLDLHDSVSVNGNLPPVRPEDNDPPFSLDGRLTGTDMADASWHLAGAVAAPIEPNGARSTRLDAEVWSDVHLLGFTIGPVVKVAAHVSTNTPPLQNNTVSPTTGEARYCYGYFGATERCVTRSGSLGVAETLLEENPSITLFNQNWWVFRVSASGGLNLKLDASGGITPNGFAVAVTPSAGIFARLEGGVSVGTFAGGGLFGQVDLFRASVPITASVAASADLDPRRCAISLVEGLSGRVELTVGSGKVGWYLEGGLTCGLWGGLCWRNEESLLDWPGLKKNIDLIPASPLARQTIPLDPSFCTPVGDAAGGITYPAAAQQFLQGTTSVLLAKFERAFQRDRPPGLPPDAPWLLIPEPLDCAHFTWSSSNPSDVISAQPGRALGCSPRIVYGSPGPRTIAVSADDPALGRGFGSVQVSVNASSPNPPVPQITGTTSTNCDASATGTATDPLGAALTLNWFMEPAHAALGSGSPIDGTRFDEGPVLRVEASAADGRRGVLEIESPGYQCIK